MYTKKQRMTALLVCIAIVFVTFFSVFFIAIEANHDCTGEDCPICVCIHTAENTLKEIGNSLAGVVAVIIAPVVLLLFFKGILLSSFCHPTLVSIKVRLNN